MSEDRHVLLRNGFVVDGSGGPGERLDVLIADGSIAEVGLIEPNDTWFQLDVAGLVVAPGFIDIHSHSDFTLLRDPRARSQINQGVTTEIVGNCGYGCCPIRTPELACEAIYGYDPSVPLDWNDLDGYFQRMETLVPAVNVASLVPNGQLRLSVVGMAARAASREETDAMAQLLEASLEQGGIGYSTGLEYPWESGATREEVTALCRVLARRGGLYATHTRDRDAHAIDAVDEAIATARDAEVALQISHIVPRRGRRDSERAIEHVDAAVVQGDDVAFDMHTRLFGTTYLKVLLPPDALQFGRSHLARMLSDSKSVDTLLQYQSLISAIGDWRKVELFSAPACPQFERQTFDAIGHALGLAPHLAALAVLKAHVDDLNAPMVLLHTYDEETLRDAYRHPSCTVGSDATALCPDGPLANSRFHGAYTWASWFFRRMVRETATFSIEHAVHKLTQQPAARANLWRRGLIRRGFAADVVVFDADTFGETATVYDPNKLAIGVRHVLVNGVLTMFHGVETGRRAGKVLRHGGRS